MEIRAMIKERRRAKRMWQQSMNPEDKRILNRISNQLNKLIKDNKNKSIEAYLEGLSAEADTNYSLWKATIKLKRPLVRIPPLKDEAGKWVHKDKDKAELFARHLSRVFQSHNIQSRINLQQPTKKI